MLYSSPLGRDGGFKVCDIKYVTMSRGRIETGVQVVDDRLNGGVPTGSLVAIVAPPQTQSELLLYRATAQRDSFYLSTLRNEANVKRAFDRSDVDLGNPMVAYAEPGIPFEEIGDVLGRSGTETTIVVDTANTLERRDPDQYQAFLNKLHTYVRRTAGIAYLHCHRTASEPAGREVTLGMADIVFELERVVDGSEIETRLLVSKFRGGTALTEPIKLELTDSITVDTSRDLA